MEPAGPAPRTLRPARRGWITAPFRDRAFPLDAVQRVEDSTREQASRCNEECAGPSKISHHGSAFPGCPRMVLKRQVERARELGYTMVTGPEAEFFLFQKDEYGNAKIETHDVGGYFDLTPVDKGEECRRDIVIVLEAMGFEVEAAHHEVAPGQHEIDFKYGEAVSCVDNVTTFRFVVKKVALDHGPRRAHRRELPPGQAPGVARVHLPRAPLGAGAVSRGVLIGEY
jgi:glutamine synthetase